VIAEETTHTHSSPVNLNINQFGQHKGRTPPKKSSPQREMGKEAEEDKNLKYFNSIFIFPS